MTNFHLPRSTLFMLVAAFSGLDTMRAASLRPEVFCEEMPAPQRIAPWSAALSGDVTIDEEDVGTGRIILLHDPAGNDAWNGTFRCVTYARADIDPELGNDPLLAAVGWSWLPPRMWPLAAMSRPNAEYSPMIASSSPLLMRAHSCSSS